MTDHYREEREALIEKAAKAIRGTTWEPSCESAARAALAVFEQAHREAAPTDDEWESTAPDHPCFYGCLDESHTVPQGEPTDAAENNEREEKP